MIVLIEAHYIPCIEFFCAIRPHQEIRIEKHERYGKQSFRNRCYVNTSQGSLRLVVPVTYKQSKTLSDVRIDYSQKWQNLHWRTLTSAYNKSPFFEYYEDPIKKILFTKVDTLLELNLKMLSFCLKSLGMEKIISESVTYKKKIDTSIIDFRSTISPKKPFFERPFYTPVAYPQVFGKAFVENLSVIDLLFCQGPHSMYIIEASQKTN